MKSYVQFVQTYVREIGEIGPKKLGDPTARPSPESLAAAQSSLERSLRKDAKKTDGIIVWQSCCCAVCSPLGLRAGFITARRPRMSRSCSAAVRLYPCSGSSVG
jgi:hypothetical protein